MKKKVLIDLILFVFVLHNAAFAVDVDLLIKQLESKNTKTRQSTIIKLVKTGGEKAAAAIISKMNDEDYLVRALAIEGVGRLNLETQKNRIKPFLNDKYDVVRLAAASSLGMLGDPIGFNIVSEIIESSLSNHVRSLAVKALRNIGDLRSLEVLINTAKKDSSAKVRLAATKALGELGDQKALKYLKYIAEYDFSSNVQDCAKEAIKKIESLQKHELSGKRYELIHEKRNLESKIKEMEKTLKYSKDRLSRINKRLEEIE